MIVYNILTLQVQNMSYSHVDVNFRAVIQAQIYMDDLWQKYLLLCQNLLECHSEYALMPSGRVDFFPIDALRKLFNRLYPLALLSHSQDVTGMVQAICNSTNMLGNISLSHSFIASPADDSLSLTFLLI